MSFTSSLPNTTTMDVNDNMMSGHEDPFLPRYLDIESLPVPTGPLEEATSFELFDQNYEQAQADNPTRDDQAADPGDGEGDEGGLCPPVGVKYQVKPLTKLVQYSEQNKYWHVKSGRTGNFCISFQLDNLPPIVENAEFYLKFELRRTNPSYVHLPVNEVCSKHLQDGLNFPIIPSTDSVNYQNYKEPVGMRRSFLSYNVGLPQPGSNQLAAEVKMRFPCADSCVNTDFVDQLETNKTGKIVMKEKARLLQLCVTLEARLGDLSQELKMTDEVSIPVWIKAIIADRELKKRLRQEDKGGAARKGDGAKRNLPAASGSASCSGTEAKRQRTGRGPALREIVGPFTEEQEEVWSSLLQTFDEDQIDMLHTIFSHQD